MVYTKRTGRKTRKGISGERLERSCFGLYFLSEFLLNHPNLASIIYKDGPFSEDERENIKLVTQSHVYSYIGTLPEGREPFEEESLNELRQKQSCDGSSSTLADYLLNYTKFTLNLLSPVFGKNFDRIFTRSQFKPAGLSNGHFIWTADHQWSLDLDR
ncbi:extra-large guanine nucleotide-binding protein 1 [Phtheirospermum japonicum]|uniref:Extra-large guanine nucleotide-binding protein 1 n=1 Tax=Phtheirospermum japonicum TaxID=374723 RepID=A0A830D2Y8_9LAMI|nr:extra-large guanine nucleotide-binding protein 1 [Phtheirospermum japonicum]